MNLDPSALTQGGIAGVLAALVVALMRRWLVPGAEHAEVKQERDHWRETAQTLAPVVTELSGHVGRLADATQQLIASRPPPAPWYPVATGRHAGPDDGPGWSPGSAGHHQTPPPSTRSGSQSRRY